MKITTSFGNCAPRRILPTLERFLTARNLVVVPAALPDREDTGK